MKTAAACGPPSGAILAPSAPPCLLRRSSAPSCPVGIGFGTFHQKTIRPTHGSRRIGAVDSELFDDDGAAAAGVQYEH